MKQVKNPENALVSELAGDLDLADLLEMFVSELPARVEAIERACAEEDFNNLVRLAHQLKGAAGSYGYPTITEAAAELERRVKSSESLDRLTEVVQGIASLCQRAQAGLTKST
jgi:HPt (histidine-containing phosphotransfer) domain-containing protein